MGGVGPVTTLLMVAGGVYVPPSYLRPQFEGLANCGIADRALYAGQHGYRLTPHGRVLFEEWVSKSAALIQFP